MNKILDGKTLKENVGIAIGYASCCWDENDVFDTTKANEITNELVNYIENIIFQANNPSSSTGL